MSMVTEMQSKYLPPALQVSPVALESQPANASCWGAQLSEPLQPGATTELDVYAVFTKLQRPFPAEVAQSEVQRMLFQESVYILSPYPVASQTTKVSTLAQSIKLGKVCVKFCGALSHHQVVLQISVLANAGANSASKGSICIR